MKNLYLHTANLSSKDTHTTFSLIKLYESGLLRRSTPRNDARENEVIRLVLLVQLLLLRLFCCVNEVEIRLLNSFGVSRELMKQSSTVPQGRHFINRRWSKAQSTDKTPSQPRIPSGMQPDSPIVGNVQFEQQTPHSANTPLGMTCN